MGIRAGKSLAAATLFLEHCRKGTRTLYMGKGYVVLPRKIYDELINNQKEQ